VKIITQRNETNANKSSDKFDLISNRKKIDSFKTERFTILNIYCSSIIQLINV